METKPKTKRPAQPKPEKPVEPEPTTAELGGVPILPDLTAGPGIVSEVAAKLPGLTPHNKRVAIVEALRLYAENPQSPEYCGLMALAEANKIKF